MEPISATGAQAGVVRIGSATLLSDGRILAGKRKGSLLSERRAASGAGIAAIFSANLARLPTEPAFLLGEMEPMALVGV